MRKNNKKALYESIMKDVAKIVKRSILLMEKEEGEVRECNCRRQRFVEMDEDEFDKDVWESDDDIDPEDFQGCNEDDVRECSESLRRIRHRRALRESLRHRPVRMRRK